MPWIRACSVGELDDGDALQLPTTPPIAVFHVDGAFYALDDTCTHGQSSLADGYVDGTQVECAWHFAKFDLKSGAALTPPANVPLCRYQVRVERDEVMVELPDRG
ncbi:bifunctional 3-phenylpropionate/cinnamic acid dioxygenase ferredoxin subunit [Amycolatopsis jiangsuensis]|uniref:3-phenylpropionate/trans-cinnamate dioxygenase ferredoxin subunit n=1 Tax=Amycolatopsis jiangsuensis TaxID=1181879 RepID=A0A840ISC9_9PSEU|nr:bifunctional 3-phenylpropionate/cinnamic acid dioxygenase ferredoxin subunit [Amycolatopsis jiangsuensis]MBB4684355.1 3-phenylpropionate/trans-cinnamate dioxygenase ferredoxin subunit [Amycolatopsis jiangsuensis]